MAKLCPHYSLCPVIEIKNFLGVSDDSVSGCVIVTLARNIVIRYKLSCQKQVSSWSSKEKLTAPVVYDSINNRYIGVFNGDKIAFWKVNRYQPLDNYKKYKFVLLIHSVLSGPGVEPVVVYKNGCVALLSTEFENRKNPHCDFNLSADQNLEDAKLINLSGIPHVYLFVRSFNGNLNANKSAWLYLIPVDPDRGEKFEIELVREDDITLVAYTVTEIETNQLITLWSDGKVFSLELPLNGETTFPGRYVSVLAGINSKLPAVIVPISTEHIAVYGADPNSEGALLTLFNIRFGLVQCSTHMKLYTNLAKLWRCSQSLFFVMGQYLAVAPYKLSTARLATLVGSHTSAADVTLAIETNWSTHTKKRNKLKEVKSKNEIKEETPLLVKDRIISMLDKGLTEISVCDELFPDFLETNDTESLLTLVTMMSDVPEVWLIKTVVFCLKGLPERRELLRETLDISLINNTTTLCLLRDNLSLESVLTLIWELARLLKEYPGNGHFIEWGSLLLDSHYQQYLLSKDQKVIDALTCIKRIIMEHLDFMKNMRELDAQILRLSQGKGLINKPLMRTKHYVVEDITLY